MSRKVTRISEMRIQAISDINMHFEFLIDYANQFGVSSNVVDAESYMLLAFSFAYDSLFDFDLIKIVRNAKSAVLQSYSNRGGDYD